MCVRKNSESLGRPSRRLVPSHGLDAQACYHDGCSFLTGSRNYLIFSLGVMLSKCDSRSYACHNLSHSQTLRHAFPALHNMNIWGFLCLSSSNISYASYNIDYDTNYNLLLLYGHFYCQIPAKTRAQTCTGFSSSETHFYDLLEW
jgi:hypothetical protein